MWPPSEPSARSRRAPVERAPYHRDDRVTIYNADSTNLSFLPDSSVDLVVTSPPYNLDVSYDGSRDDLLCRRTRRTPDPPVISQVAHGLKRQLGAEHAIAAIHIRDALRIGTCPRAARLRNRRGGGQCECG